MERTAAGLAMYSAKLKSQIETSSASRPGWIWENSAVGRLASGSACSAESQELLNDLKYEMEEEAQQRTRIKVIGVGGGGCNAVARMVQEGLEGVEFYAMNTDAQALAACAVPNKLQLGAKITNGLGAGANPDIGRQAALENTDQIVELLQGADMVFVTAGLGGGTGTGAAPVIASLAKELDALTVAVVTKPFGFEGAAPYAAGRRRARRAGVHRRYRHRDSERPAAEARSASGTSFFEAFKMADDLLRQAVQGISDIIVTPGLINRDFSDIKATMVGHGIRDDGHRHGAAARTPRSRRRARRSVARCSKIRASRGSRGILINITGSSQLGLHEVNEACSIIREAAECEDVQINFGVILNESMERRGEDHGDRDGLPAGASAGLRTPQQRDAGHSPHARRHRRRSASRSRSSSPSRSSSRNPSRSKP